MLIRKYLYHSNNIPKCLTFLGILKLLISGRINRPEFALSRLIVCLYKSYDISDKVSEDYHVKIFEFFKNFLIIYIPSARKNKKVLLDAILPVLTGFFCKDGLTTSDGSVINDYIGTRFDFLYSLLNIIRNMSKDDKFDSEYVSFKIMKYISFLILYFNDNQLDVEMEDSNADENSKSSHVRSKTNDFKKKHKIPFLQRKSMALQIKKLLERFKIDTLALSIRKKVDMEDEFKKLIVITNEVNNTNNKWTNYSDEIHNFYQNLENKSVTIKDNNVEINTILSEKEEYYLKTETKYFKKIEEFYGYLLWIKTEKLGMIMEESFIDDSRLNISTNVGRGEDIQEKGE